MMLINSQLFKSPAAYVEYKIVVLGKENSGKTSLVERYIYDRFCDSATYQSTIGTAFGAKRLIIEGQPITMGIWDTAGSERYESMSRIYYRGAAAAIVCFDITDYSSFEKAEFWIRELRQCEENCKVYLSGTKIDLVRGYENKANRRVDYHNALDFSDEMGATYMETSSKDGENTEELFKTIAKDLLSDPRYAPIISDKKRSILLKKPSAEGTKLPDNVCASSKWACSC